MCVFQLLQDEKNGQLDKNLFGHASCMVLTFLLFLVFIVSVIPNLKFVLLIYLYTASFTYTMLTNAWNEKREAEEDMKLVWLKENGYVSQGFYSRFPKVYKTTLKTFTFP